MDKVIALDIWGDYAHFKKFHTTASPLTFSVPPPTAIMGILGAIIGLKPGEYQRVLNEHVKVSLRILSEVRKMRMGINWIDTKGARHLETGKIKNRTQIWVEYLRNPCFRIYVLSNDTDLYNKLKEMINQHRTYYTLYLGITECIANFLYAGEYEIHSKREGIADIHSVLPLESLVEVPDKVAFEPGRKYVRERMPIRMDEERKVELYQDVIIETTGETIKCKSKEYMELKNGERIVLF